MMGEKTVDKEIQWTKNKRTEKNHLWKKDPEGSNRNFLWDEEKSVHKQKIYCGGKKKPYAYRIKELTVYQETFFFKPDQFFKL